jgi:low affinity Fe/Cu permease
MLKKKTQKRKSSGNSNNGDGESRLQRGFSLFAMQTARMTGKPGTFLLAFAVIIVWAITGPLFGYSDTWQLVINTGTTIVTFLMVFLIQNTQNRDTMALQLKLSEVILAMKGVPNRFATIEDLSDEDLEELHDECRLRADKAIEHLNQRRAHQSKTKGRGGSQTTSNGSK